jgi:hypothetical protein
VLYRSFTLSPRKWLHFLPFIAAFLITELIYLSRPKGYLLALLNKMTERRIPLAFYWTSGIIFLQYFIYLAACLRLMRQYKKVVQDNFSDPRRADLRWLYATILFFSCCMFLTAFNGFLGLTAWSKYYYFVFGAIVGLLFVFIYRILLATLLRPAIFGLLEERAPDAIAACHLHLPGRTGNRPARQGNAGQQTLPRPRPHAGKTGSSPVTSTKGPVQDDQ